MTDLLGLAAVISALLTPASVMFLAWINNRSVKRVEAKVEVVDEKIADVHQIAEQVDAAVNGKGPGEPSISQDVTAIKHKQEADSPTPTTVAPVIEPLVPMVTSLAASVAEVVEMIRELRERPGRDMTTTS